MSYIDRARLPYPFCPGCSHGSVLDALDRAVVRLGKDPRRVVVVTDIGCVGLSDQYFLTNAFHGLHGRSVTYATGIKLADPDLTVVVLIGDGGCGIGAGHLVHAARRNVGMAVVVFNNFNFGMTGGQHSPLTPPGAITATTPGGHVEWPMDVAGTVALNGASFAARTTAFDPHLDDLLYQALATDGFSLVEVWELCTAYFVPGNRFGRKVLEQALERSALASGVVVRRTRPEYARLLRQGPAGPGPSPLRTYEARFAPRLAGRRSLVVAGAAGQKVRSAAALLGRAAVLSGLYAVQRDDYPVTVMTGHSVSEVILSDRPVAYTGVSAPDTLVVLAPEGAARAVRAAAAMDPSGRLYVARELAARFDGRTRARIELIDTGRLPRRRVAAAAVAFVAEREGWVEPAALEQAASEGRPEVVREMREAIAARAALSG